MEHISQRSRRELLLFSGGALLGLFAFLLVLGIMPLDVTNDAVCRGGYIEKDLQQHYAGWLFYRNEALGWPLGVTPAINAPQGLSVAYTDSIPLFAVLLRPLANALGGIFQYFGWFTLLCCMLQGGFGALLLGLYAQDCKLVWLGDLLFVFSPILWERVLRHTSLAAQWLVLGALYYYIRGRREKRFAYAGLFLLNVLTLTIHPYFVPMTYAVTLALLVEHAVTTRKIAGPAAFLVGDLAATVAAGGLLGLFYGTATGGSEALYGYFGMNLNALWNPAGVGGVAWSRLLPVQNQVGGNYDAFAYLGLGVLLALVLGGIAALVMRRVPLRRLLAQHWMLAVDCGLLTVFAVSHVITANGATLAVLPLPAALLKLCSMFRSGGRMFWPVYYLLLLGAFVLLCRLPRRAVVRTALVAGMAVVQLWDISPALLQRHEALRQAQTAEAFPSQLQSDFWAQAAGRYATIASMDGLQDDALHLALFAADHRMTTNDPFAARYDAEALAQQRATLQAELAQGLLRGDTLYLFHDEGAFLQAVEPVRAQAWCGRIDGSDGSWYAIAPGLQDWSGDAYSTAYDANYPLRLADYTDALWNRGVLDATKQTVCFADSPFARAKLENATALGVGGQWYDILKFDDHDPGWLMVTLAIDDATVLWDQPLEVR